VDDVRSASYGRCEPLAVEDVAVDEREVRMVTELRARERVPMQVVDRDELVLVHESPGEGRRDEPGSAGDDDALSGQ
jgi:hypothetical protein